MKGTIINNIILDNTTFLAMNRKYNELWNSPELEQIIKNTIKVIIHKVSSFKFVEKDEVENMLYIRFAEYVNKYTPVLNGELITFRAYIITKLQILQKYPSGLGHSGNFVDINRKIEIIPATCVKLATQSENDVDSIANILTSDGQEDSYTLENSKKVIIELVQQNDFFTNVEKEIIINYVQTEVDSHVAYCKIFGKTNLAGRFSAIRHKLRKNPTGLNDLLDYLCDYDEVRKNKIINKEKIRKEKIEKNKPDEVKKRKKIRCISPNGKETIYSTMMHASRDLNIYYYSIRDCVMGKLEDVEGYKFIALD